MHSMLPISGPNNSFKPTPHRGVNSVLYATLHAVATPLQGGLTQALGATRTISRSEGTRQCRTAQRSCTTS